MNRVVDSHYKHAKAIRVIPLDQLDAQLPIRILKMDVEGFEYQALQGAKRWLSNPELNVIILELNASGTTFGTSDSTLVRLLEDYGFYPYRYDPFLRKVTRLQGHNKSQFNTIFIRDLLQVENRVTTAAAVTILNRSI